MTPMVEHALAAARRGERVLAMHSPTAAGGCSCGDPDCPSPGKHPREAGWPERATTNLDAIRRTWARWPDANVGLATGSGRVVLDVDPRNGGDETLHELEREHGPLPETRRVKTGGGGEHLYFAIDPDEPIGNLNGALGAGLDLRADGGCVLAPGSRSASGRTYDEDGEAPVAPWAGTWLQAKAREATARRNGQRAVGVGEIVLDPAAEPPAVKLEALIAHSEKFRRTWTRTRREPTWSPSEWSLSIASLTAAAGWSDQEIADAMIADRREHGGKAHPVEWYRRTIATARSGVELAPPQAPATTAPEAADRSAPLRFLTPAELRAMAPEEPPWCWHGYAARGAVTLLAGKPKVGKSTLALAVAEAIATGAPDFLGRAVSAARVLYVSEEGAMTLAHKLPTGEDVRILSRDLAWPKPPWEALVAACVEEAERVGAGLLVIDTLSFWGALPAEREKDAGAAQAAMAPLIDAARGGLAVLIVHHQRKGGGEEGEGVRGSSALAGAADVVLELERPPRGKGDHDPRQRLLVGLSRYPQTPDVLIIDHDPSTGGWGVIGEAADRAETREAADRAAILAALEGTAEATRRELEDATGVDGRRLSPLLKELERDGAIAHSGEGKKGDPYRFRILPANAAHGAGQNRAETGARGIRLSARPLWGGRNESNVTESATAPAGQKACSPTLEDAVLADPDAVALAVGGSWE